MDEAYGFAYLIACIIVAAVSIICSLIVVVFLKKKTSIYARLIRHIALSESIFIFSELIIVFEQNSSLIAQYNNIINRVFCFLHFQMAKEGHKVISAANRSVYLGMEAFSLILNGFICLEMILILKNPIAQLKGRVKTYFASATFAGLCIFLLSFITSFNSKANCLSAIFNELAVALYINLSIFILFVIIGLISIIYLMARFCYGKPLLQNLKNVFVIRHLFYLIIYIGCSVLLKINSIYVLQYKDFIWPKETVLLNLATGALMFIIRASETKILWKLLCCRDRRDANTSFDETTSTVRRKDSKEEDVFFDKDQPLTAIISKNMNLEFMCCILFGLTEIFMKPERIKKSLPATEDATVTVIRPQQNLMTLSSEGMLSGMKMKDFQSAKTHKIRYKKIFNEDIDFEQLGVEVLSSNADIKSKRQESSVVDSDSLLENNKIDHDALVIEYCPKLFRELRRLDEIDGMQLDKSLNPINNEENFTKILESQGKSGSFFFFSHDHKFIIKTITNNELNTMLGSFMKGYYEHIITCRETLLAKIYGLYSIDIKGVSKINVILMQNIIPIPKKHVKRIFDLKGSRVERFTKNIEKCDKLRALKDLDYLWMTKIEPDLVDFTKDEIEALQESLQTDLSQLRELGVMDYSLLLVILYFPQPQDPDYSTIIHLLGDPRYCHKVFKSRQKKYIYILGIIDYLQKFNVSKFFENKYKSIVYGNEIKYVSAVDPMIYSERLFNFARDYIFITSNSGIR